MAGGERRDAAVDAGDDHPAPGIESGKHRIAGRVDFQRTREFLQLQRNRIAVRALAGDHRRLHFRRTDAADADTERLILVTQSRRQTDDTELRRAVRRIRVVAGQARPRCDPGETTALDRKSVVWGKGVAVRVDLGRRGIIKKKKETTLK